MGATQFLQATLKGFGYKLYGAVTGATGVVAPLNGNVNLYTLPATILNTGFLQTDALGNLTWTPVSGASAITTTSVTEGTNLYYTQARFDTAFAAKSTTNLTEGTNLYYTNARAITALTTTANTWTALQTLVCANSSTQALILKKASGQTANFLELQDTAGVAKAYFTADYGLIFQLTNCGKVPFAIFTPQNKIATVSNKALTSNVATVTTSAAHTFLLNETVVITGVDATFNGTWVITSLPSTTTFTFAVVSANVVSISASGTATVYPTANVFQSFSNTSVQQIWISQISTDNISQCLNLRNSTDSLFASSFSITAGATLSVASYGNGGLFNGPTLFSINGVSQCARFGFGGVSAAASGPFGANQPNCTTLSQGVNIVYTNLVLKAIANQTGDQLQVTDSANNIQATINSVGFLGIGTRANMSPLTVQQPAQVNGITGTTTVNASTTLIGSGTVFTKQLAVGDRISLSSAPATYGVVTAIGNDTVINISPAIGDGTTQTINVLHSIVRITDNTAALKFFMDSFGRIALGGATLSPSAALHLPGCTATASTAPLKMNTGTVLTTPEDGAFEYDGTHLYFTIGSTRHTLV